MMIFHLQLVLLDGHHHLQLLMIAEVDEFPFCHPYGEFFMPLMHWLVTKGFVLLR